MNDYARRFQYIAWCLSDKEEKEKEQHDKEEKEDEQEES